MNNQKLKVDHISCNMPSATIKFHYVDPVIARIYAHKLYRSFEIHLFRCVSLLCFVWYCLLSPPHSNEVHFDWKFNFVINTRNTCVSHKALAHVMRFQWNHLSSSSWKKSTFFLAAFHRSLKLFLFIRLAVLLAALLASILFIVPRQNVLGNKLKVLFTWHFE